jgi:serine/threonine-protein kinase
VVATCLAKDPADRWQTAADLARQLRWIVEDGAGPAAESARRVAGPQGLRLAVAAGLAAVGIGIAVGWLIFGRVPRELAPADGVKRLALALPPDTSIGSQEAIHRRLASGRPSQTALDVSPDGTRLVFVGIRQGTQQLFLRRLDRETVDAIPESERAHNPFFSPDGQWIGFWARQALRKVPVAGGPAVDLVAKVPPIRGAHWHSGSIVYADGVIKQIGEGGSEPKVLTTLEAGERSHAFPQIVAGGRALLFTARAGYDLRGARIVVQSLATGERKILADNAAHGRVLRDEFLLFMRAGTLMAATFDPRQLTAGPPIGALGGVMQAYNSAHSVTETGAGQFAVSDGGDLFYLTGGILEDLRNTLVWFDRSGAPAPVPAEAGAYTAPRLSPDLQRAVLYGSNIEKALLVLDFPRRRLTRLPFGGEVWWPLWNPDGSRIAFAGVVNGAYRLYWMQADGSAPAEALTPPSANAMPAAWSANGEELLFIDSGEDGSDIFRLRLSDRRIERVIATGKGYESYPTLSPDDRWLAYVSPDSKRDEVYVAPYPAMDRRYQISNNGGSAPVWTREGRELLYIEHADNRNTARLMSVQVTTKGEFAATNPRRLFEKPVSEFGGGDPFRGFDVTSDGERILGVTPRFPNQPPPPAISVIANWITELRTRLGTAR